MSHARSNRDTGRLTEMLSPWHDDLTEGNFHIPSFPGSPNVLWYLVRMTCDLKGPEKWKLLQRWHSSSLKKVPNSTFEASTSWNKNRNPCLRKASAFEFPAELFATIIRRNQCWSGCSLRFHWAKCSKTLHRTVCYSLLTSSIACVLLCVSLLSTGLIGTVFVGQSFLNPTSKFKETLLKAVAAANQPESIHSNHQKTCQWANNVLTPNLHGEIISSCNIIPEASAHISTSLWTTNIDTPMTPIANFLRISLVKLCKPPIYFVCDPHLQKSPLNSNVL